MRPALNCTVGCYVQGSRFTVKGCKVQGARCRVQGTSRPGTGTLQRADLTWKGDDKKVPSCCSTTITSMAPVRVAALISE